MAGRAVLQVDQAKPADQNVLWNFRERRQSSGLDCCLRVRSGRHHEKAALKINASLYTLLQVLSVTIFERMPLLQALTEQENNDETIETDNQLILFN